MNCDLVKYHPNFIFWILLYLNCTLCFHQWSVCVHEMIVRFPPYLKCPPSLTAHFLPHHKDSVHMQKIFLTGLCCRHEMNRTALRVCHFWHKKRKWHRCLLNEQYYCTAWPKWYNIHNEYLEEKHKRPSSFWRLEHFGTNSDSDMLSYKQINKWQHLQICILSFLNSDWRGTNQHSCQLGRWWMRPIVPLSKK